MTDQAEESITLLGGPAQGMKIAPGHPWIAPCGLQIYIPRADKGMMLYERAAGETTATFQGMRAS